MSLPGERLAGKDLVRVDIFVTGARDDVGRKWGWWARLVPARGFEPVANILLVERRLRMPRRVSFHRPVARAVRSQNLIDESERTAALGIGYPTDFKLRVGQDQATAFGISAGVGVRFHAHF